MKSFLSSLGTVLLGLLWLGGIGALFVGGAWLATTVEPWVNLLAWIVILVGVPLSLILLIPRKTRAYGGMGLYIVSLPIGLWIWIVSVIYALTVSFFWTVIGVIFGGIGIVPVALIMTLIRRDWPNCGGLVGTLVVVLVLRFLGLGIASRAEEREALEAIQRAHPEISPSN